MKKFLVIIVFLILGQSLHAEVRIAVVGVGDDMNLIERWAAIDGHSADEAGNSESFRINDANALVQVPGPGTSLAEVASALYQANAAVIVIDATQGPLPVNREHIILARQARVPVVAIMLANVDDLHALAPEDATELLRLEEEEVRYLMEAYELDGRSALLFHDANVAANAPMASAGELGSAVSMIARISKGGDRNPPAQPQRQARGQVYLLTAAETNGNSASISGPASMVIWSEGSSTTAEVSSATAAAPGDVAEVSIRAQRMFSGRAGSRFLLIKDESLVGLGVLTEVGRSASPR